MASETAENLTDAQYEIASLTTDVEELKAGWTATDIAVADLMRDLNVAREEALASNVRIAELASTLNVATLLNWDSSIGAMPGSCADLRRIEHVKNGIHLAMGEKGVESVYCDFTSEGKSFNFCLSNSLSCNLNIYVGKNRWIGYADVKTAPVYFSVQRTSRFNKTNVPIPFDLAKSAIGNAMNLTSGIFTAPKTGTYFFIFNGLVEFDETSNVIPYLAVGLFLNKSGNRIALALTEEAYTVKDQYRGQRAPLALQTTIRLQEGDQVWLEILAQSGTVSLFDNTNNHSAFTGWLMEEEISL
ncbi:putative C1q and tumor necrosis factor-related protein 2 [Daphnia magna]|uniref:Putative C1q and tumor necrosis factor-related protein 2 n=1 Tax=Daphnia magna TaxID=35525 RepID=A0A164ZQ84_9CRUS|nr:putative C1q and tumor necrosis factor-related protein 2 [Daphnia magna]